MNDVIEFCLGVVGLAIFAALSGVFFGIAGAVAKVFW